MGEEEIVRMVGGIGGVQMGASPLVVVVVVEMVIGEPREERLALR